MGWEFRVRNTGTIHSARKKFVRCCIERLRRENFCELPAGLRNFLPLISYPKGTMRRAFSLLFVFFLLLLLLPCCCRAQDASKIIDQYVKAAGGSKALGKVQTILVDGTVQAGGDDKPGTYTFRVKLPNRYYTELRGVGKTRYRSV